jgi:hypothetical protein
MRTEKGKGIHGHYDDMILEVIVMMEEERKTSSK